LDSLLARITSRRSYSTELRCRTNQYSITSEMPVAKGLVSPVAKSYRNVVTGYNCVAAAATAADERECECKKYCRAFTDVYHGFFLLFFCAGAACSAPPPRRNILIPLLLYRACSALCKRFLMCRTRRRCSVPLYRNQS